MIINKLHLLMANRAEPIRNMSELARLTGLDRRTLTAIYDGKNKGVDFSTLNVLCNFFNCTIGDIIEYVPDKGE